MTLVGFPATLLPPSIALSLSPLPLLVLSLFLPASGSSGLSPLCPLQAGRPESAFFWLKSPTLQKQSQFMSLPFPAGDDVYLHLGA